MGRNKREVKSVYPRASRKKQKGSV